MCSCIWLTPPRLAFSSYLRGRPSTNYYIWFNKVVVVVVVKKWRGKSFWSPALGKQRGVAVLVSENTNFELSQWMRDSSGRIVSVLACLGDQRYNFVNIYPPTNPTERHSFFDSLPDYFALILL